MALKPNADPRPDPSEVKESWFFEKEEGKLLLKCFRERTCTWNGSEPDGSFRVVLKLIDDKYIEELTNIKQARPKTMARERKRIREEWREDRINLYDKLFNISSDTEDGKLEVVQFPKSGSINKHLLDYIHEHDDVMLKYYDAKDCNKLHRSIPEFKKRYFSFWKYMETYRTHLINPLMDEALEASTEETITSRFNAMIDYSGKKSWRYKARMFWLLSRFQHIAVGRSYKYKTTEYVGPVGVLCRKISLEENRMLLDDDTNFAPKVMKNGAKLHTLDHYSSLLGYACAKDDYGLVTRMLESKKEFEKEAEYDIKWENRWKDTWAKALWFAAYKGRGAIVKKLLQECGKLYSTEYYSVTKELTQPLHAAVRRRHESVVEVFCTVGPNCHEKDHFSDDYTPLELATECLEDEPNKKKRIQSILLTTSAVSRAVEESQAQRELTVGSANAIMVGAALIAGVTYAGWLQPPLGYQPYDQFTEPVPGASDEPLSYMFVQGRSTIRLFAISNALSFFFAIAAIVAGMETACYIGEIEDMYMTKKVKNLHGKLKRTRTLFIVCVIFVLIAFSSAAIAVLPPTMRFQKDTYITIAVGGFICLAMTSRFLFIVSKRRVFNIAKKHMACMFTNTKDKLYKTSEDVLPSSLLKFLKAVKFYLEEGN